MMNVGKLAGKTLFITGASRGIGKAIALKAARDGANVVIAAKTAEPHPKLPGTIYTAADEIEQAGGQALPCIVDVRSEKNVQKAVDEAVKQFGGIDIVVNNASAISLTGTAATPMKIYDLMNEINARGTYLCSKLCYPHLVESARHGQNPHIMNISPPLSMRPVWFKNHTAYTMAKFGMSMCVLGMADEFKPDGIAVNALWPKTAIITAAMEMLGGGDIAAKCRTPEIMADAAYAILIKQSDELTGQFLIDEKVLIEEGITDMKQYAVDPDQEPILDFFLDENEDAFEKEDSVFQSKKARSQAGKIFQAIEKSLSEDIVNSIGGVYKFELTGDSPMTWLVDLKNGSGSVAASGGESDVTMKLTEADFVSMFTGQLSATQAFMQGKLAIEGNMGLAMKLETLMKNTKIEVSDDDSGSESNASTSGSVTDDVIQRMRGMLNADTVQKIQATYLFKLTGEADETWTLNLKEGEGSIVQGSEGEPDVTMTMPSEVFVNVFNSKLAPTQAFMTGKLDIKGNMGLAMRLESIIKQINKLKL